MNRIRELEGRRDGIKEEIKGRGRGRVWGRRGKDKVGPTIEKSWLRVCNLTVFTDEQMFVEKFTNCLVESFLENFVTA